MKKVYIFNNTRSPHIQGYTLDETGANLPKAFDEEWQFFKAVFMEKESTLIGISPKVILETIELKGYYIKQNRLFYT